MPLDRTPAAPADPLVVVLEDMGKHGLNAETYSLSYAIEQAADFEQGEGGFRITDIRYVSGDSFGEPVKDFAAMVAEAICEREDDAAERVAMNRDYYAGLGVRTGRVW